MDNNFQMKTAEQLMNQLGRCELLIAREELMVWRTVAWVVWIAG